MSCEPVPLSHVSTVPSLSTDTPGVSKRQKIVNEIYSSEQTYISQLSLIVDVSEPINASLCHTRVCPCVHAAVVEGQCVCVCV